MSERETKNPYTVLQRIIDKNPDAAPSVWRAQFLREVMDDPDLQRAVVDKVLTDMTPRERMVFEMRHYQGMRLRAIGDVLGTTEEAAKNCLFRATQKMRAALGDFV